MIDKVLSVTYAASVALSQALVTFAQVRADQLALAKMTDSQIRDMMKTPEKAPIGFNREPAT
tara:strand:+ start:3899 stop:4084 length:186 start_codon:yes stop_codon:yes gene_type:complete